MQTSEQHHIVQAKGTQPHQLRQAHNEVDQHALHTTLQALQTCEKANTACAMFGVDMCVYKVHIGVYLNASHLSNSRVSEYSTYSFYS
jgi:hypothetical protein